jgi:hypothetical protein
MKKFHPVFFGFFALAALGSLHAEPVEAEPAAAVEAPILQAVDQAALEAKLGSEVVVEGVIKAVGKTPTGTITFLNFGDRKTGFVAIIFQKAYASFPDGFDGYANQKVRVRGTLEKYQDRQVQLQLTTPDQIEVVQETP